MKAIIIAGGPGTRLRPLTYATAKPIIPMVNRPFLVHQIESLKKHGITQIILNLHYKAEQIEKMLGNGSSMGVKLFYSYEDKPLDTAGAVKNAQEFFDKDPMIVCNGDILTDLDLTALLNFHKEKKADLTFTLTRVDDPSAYGLIVTNYEGRVSQFLEKPKKEDAIVDTVNAGTYVINPDLFDFIPPKSPHSFERQFFPKMLELGKRLYGFVSDSYWMDIGTPQKYFQSRVDILTGKISVNTHGKKQGTVLIDEGVQVAPTAELKGVCVIGKNSKIGNSVKLNNVIIHENVVIEDNVQMTNAILCDRTQIEAESHLPDGLILAADSVVKKGSKTL
jgi:NDP-sugar pyrophosphorylase family protein